MVLFRICFGLVFIIIGLSVAWWLVKRYVTLPRFHMSSIAPIAFAVFALILVLIAAASNTSVP